MKRFENVLRRDRDGVSAPTEGDLQHQPRAQEQPVSKVRAQARALDVPEIGRRVTFAFEVEDIRSARADLLARGIEPVTDIEGGPDAKQFWAYFKDAEGNLFELVQRLQ